MPDTSPNILLLCENDNAAQLDRRALREAGFAKTRIMHNGVDAARLLAGIENDGGFMPDIVVCAWKLEDMDGERFCAIIRQHPRLLALPVLLVTPSENDAEQLRALGCGASALLARPYAIDTLKERLDALAANIPQSARLRGAARQVDTSAFDEALETYGVLLSQDKRPDDYFKIGKRCLEEKRWNQAISAFEQALRYASIEAEAQLGMAAAFRGKGDMARFREWLARAAETFMRARRWPLARASYARLLRHDPSARNPFLAEAHKFIRQQEYECAAEILAHGLEAIPEGEADDKFARACFMADDPEAMLKALETALTCEKANTAAPLEVEIRKRLDDLTREKEERQRLLAVERKWRLAREMAERQKNQAREQAAAIEPARAGPMAAENEVPSLADIGEETLADMVLDQSNSDAGIDDLEAAAGPVLAPLSKNEATSELFAKSPKFNELLSVMKFTWKLARGGKKKK